VTWPGWWGRPWHGLADMKGDVSWISKFGSSSKQQPAAAASSSSCRHCAYSSLDSLILETRQDASK
jgi:hypothetical protein